MSHARATSKEFPVIAIPMTVNHSLAEARRLPILAAPRQRVSAWELVILVVAGVLSGATSFAIRGWGIPGSTVVQGILPMAAGLVMVPRRGSGLLMGTSALATGLVLCAASTINVNPSALARLWLLGACLDFGLSRNEYNSRIWLAFITAGMGANLLGYGVKQISAQLGWEGVGGRGISYGWPVTLMSYAICGAIAGGVSAILFFRRPDKT